MALIGKIRNNLWLVVVLLGLAMLGFLIMDMDKGGSVNSANPIVGEIGGTTITRVDFENELQRAPSNTDYNAYRNAVWNLMKENSIVKQETDKLGISVPAKELEGLKYGPLYSPVMAREFPHPQRRGFPNQEQINQIRQLEATKQLNPNFMPTWNKISRDIENEQLRTKLLTLVAKSVYTPTWQVNLLNADQKGVANINYVRIPFDDISNNEVKLGEADYQKYLDENQLLYQNDLATQTIDYVVFDVIPTDKDSADLQKKLAEEIPNLKEKSEKDLQYFVESKLGTYDEAYFLKDELSPAIADSLFSGSIGQVFGPYLDGDKYKAAKLLGVNNLMPDSVKARHILRTIPQGNINPNALQNAKDTILMIKKMIEEEGFTFDSLARRFSQDPSNSANGGEFSTLIPLDPTGKEQRQGSLIKPLNDVFFYQAKKGELKVVETDLGVHLIEVTQAYNSGKKGVKVAYLEKLIVPSKSTKTSIYTKASRFAQANPSLSALQEAVKKDNDLSISTTKPLDENGFAIEGLGSNEGSRNIVKWANDAKVGDVSPTIYRFTEPTKNYEYKYVVAAVASKNKAGVPSLEIAKPLIQNFVMNQKKGEMIVSKLPSDRSDLAALATQYEIPLDSLKVTFNGFSAQLNDEPKVIGAAFSLEEGQISQPIIGANGVYIVQMVNKPIAPPATNIPSLRAQMSRGKLNGLQDLVPALLKKSNVVDNRNKYY